MLTPVFVNGFDIESGNQGKTIRKFQPYTPTSGFGSSFEQGTLQAGRYGGAAWSIFNTAFSEMNYTALVPHADVVTFHLNFQPRDGYPGSPVIFARFQLGNLNQIALQIRPDGKIQVVIGGVGRNGTGVLGATTSTVFAVNTWYCLEVRVAFGSPGNVRIWSEGVEVLNYSGATNPQGSGCDRFTLRWELFGPPGMAFDDLVLCTGDATIERFGQCRIMAVPVTADFSIGDWSAVNTWPGQIPGGHHYSCVNDLASDHDRESPDDDISYLAGAPGSTDLFGLQEPACVGLILAVALNIAAKALAGAPKIRPQFYSGDSGATLALGADLTPESARYAVQQRVAVDSPASGGAWTDQELTTGAFGLSGVGSGSQRVSVVYLEKVVDVTGKPYECGGGNSYIY